MLWHIELKLCIMIFRSSDCSYLGPSLTELWPIGCTILYTFLVHEYIFTYHSMIKVLWKLPLRIFMRGVICTTCGAVVYLYMYLRKINEQLGWIIWKKGLWGFEPRTFCFPWLYRTFAPPFNLVRRLMITLFIHEQVKRTLLERIYVDSWGKVTFNQTYKIRV